MLAHFTSGPLRRVIVQSACHLNAASWISHSSIFGIQDLTVPEQQYYSVSSFSPHVRSCSGFLLFDDDVDDQISLDRGIFLTEKLELEMTFSHCSPVLV